MSEPGHVFVVGGTGMLASAVHELVAQGWRASVLARRASGAFPAHMAWDCDYHDDQDFARTLDGAVAQHGPINLAIAWFHTLKIDAPRRLAQAIGASGTPGRYVQVLGSAVADPARQDRLEIAAGVTDGVSNCALRQVVLGFQLGDDGSRWLTNAEISRGVLDAIAADARFHVVGVTEPWARRPTA